MERIGLIAGNRKFPLLVSEAAKKRNYEVVAIAIRGETSSLLGKFADKIYWIRLAEFKKMFEILRKEEIKNVIMAGQISPRQLFSKEIYRDQEARALLDSIKDKKADTIFGAITAKLRDSGFNLLESTIFLEDKLPEKGTLTRLKPDVDILRDVDFGLELAKAIAALDIGQTVAVKSRAIVAVEALEGTDNLIRRAGKISRGGITVVKVSKPKQDLRFDIPVIGLNTVKNLVKAKGRCLAVESKKTLFIDKEDSIRLADKSGICILAV